jgi:hypothetical protein
MIFLTGDVTFNLLLASELRTGESSEFSSVQRKVAHDWTALVITWWVPSCNCFVKLNVHNVVFEWNVAVNVRTLSLKHTVLTWAVHDVRRGLHSATERRSILYYDQKTHKLFHKLSHPYMFRHYRVIHRELVINTLPSYTSMSSASALHWISTRHKPTRTTRKTDARLCQTSLI